MPDHQFTTKALTLHTFNATEISQRTRDGYMDATAACTATGKLFGHYRSNQTTQNFLQALESDIGIPIAELIQTVMGGEPGLQGTWVHPLVAVHLAQWCSPQFAVFVSKLFVQWMHTSKNPVRTLKPLKPLTPAQVQLEEAKTDAAQVRVRISQAKTNILQERFEARKVLLDIMHTRALPVSEPGIPGSELIQLVRGGFSEPQLPPPPRQLPVIQWLDDHHYRLTKGQEMLFGKLCASLSRIKGRPIAQIADRRFSDGNGGWKSIGGYDEEVIAEAWTSFRRH